MNVKSIFFPVFFLTTGDPHFGPDSQFFKRTDSYYANYQKLNQPWSKSIAFSKKTRASILLYIF